MLTSHQRISVIIPTYDRPDFLQETLDSLHAQTFKAYEIIIVDDHSLTCHWETLEDLRNKNSGVFLYRLPEHRGVSAARNCGLDKAKGDYVLFLDDDDLLHPEMLEAAIQSFRANNNIDVSVCLYELFFSTEKKDNLLPLSLPSNHEAMSQNPLELIDFANPVPGTLLAENPILSFLRFLIPINSCLVKRESIGNIRFPENLTQGEDTFFWLSLSVKGCRFVRRDDIHVFVRKHAKNTRGRNSHYYQDIIQGYETMLAQNVLRGKEAVFYVRLKLLYFKLKIKQTVTALHVFSLFMTPGLLASKFIRYSLRRFQVRK